MDLSREITSKETMFSELPREMKVKEPILSGSPGLHKKQLYLQNLYTRPHSLNHQPKLEKKLKHNVTTYTMLTEPAVLYTTSHLGWVGCTRCQRRVAPRKTNISPSQNRRFVWNATNCTYRHALNPDTNPSIAVVHMVCSFMPLNSNSLCPNNWSWLVRNTQYKSPQ